MTPEQFFAKYLKYIALFLLLLLCIKSIQSCNRNMSLSITKKEYVHTVDSLNNRYNNLEKETTKTIDQLRFELKLQNEKVGAAEKRANAVIEVAEKIKANTTINVRGVQLDTLRKK